MTSFGIHERLVFMGQWSRDNWALIAVVFILDRLTKAAVLWGIPSSKLSLLPFLHLVHVWNRGVSFGLLGSTSFCWALCLTVLACILSGLAVGFYAYKTPKVIQKIIAVVVGSGLSNAVDRMLWGAVFDFIYIEWRGWAFPAFNVADVCISLSVAAVLYYQLLSKRNISVG